MSLKAQLIEDMKIALKAHEAEKLSAVRYALSEIKRVEIDAGELDDVEAQKVLSKLIKQAQESIEQYQIGKRADLVTSEEFKIAVWQNYLPEPLSDEQLEQMVLETIKTQVSANFASVMPLVIKQVAGRAAGQKVAETVKKLL